VEGGTVLHSIKINTLADLKIPIPTVEKQRLIVNIAQTNSKIEKLYKELVKQESKLATAKIQKFLGGKLQ
jgi:restriction endonuclease S subunit